MAYIPVLDEGKGAPTDERPMPHRQQWTTTRVGLLFVAERQATNTMADGTAASYRVLLRVIDRVLGGGPLRTLDRHSAVEALRAVGSRSAGSKRTRLSQLRTFCRWAVGRGYLDHDPTAGLPPPRQQRRDPRALRADQVTSMFEAAASARDRAILALMAWSGLRCCEVSALQLRDWDRVASTVTVTGKGGHRRTVPIPDAAADVLGAYLAETPDLGETDWVIRVSGDAVPRRRGGAPISPKWISTIVAEIAYDAGVKHTARDGVGAHSLRHTAAVDVLDRAPNGTGLVIVQEMLGHSDLAVTSRYMRRMRLGEMASAMAGREYWRPPPPNDRGAPTEAGTPLVDEPPSPEALPHATTR